MSNLYKTQGPVKVKLGTRVVRGPNWNHKCEDNGEGFVGTIVGLTNSDRFIQVIWDTGRSGRYRADPNQYDLRIFDNAQTDELHINTVCTGCRESPIHGIKWTCTKCKINLCTQCYMSDKHDIKHIFERTDTPNSGIYKVGSRKKATKKIVAKGVFEGAEVVVSTNLTGGTNCNNNDIGYVEQITNWKNKYHRGIVKIFWKDTETEITYRLGAEGCVDIVCSRLTETATGGKYYPDHLPVVEFDDVCSYIPVQEFQGSVAPIMDLKVPEEYVESILPTEISEDVIIKEAGNGIIWKGEWKNSKRTPVSIKMFKPGSHEDVLREAHIMKLCSHKNVVKIYGTTATFDWIVMEWFSDLNLLDSLCSNDVKWSVATLKSRIIKVAVQIASGMRHLETNRIVHRNLKTANILIGDKDKVKIGGFDYAVNLGVANKVFIEGLIPDKWTSPESINTGEISIKSDVWAFGILLMELVTFGEVPYPGKTLEEIKKVFESLPYILPRPATCPVSIYSIMLNCWQRSPEKRLTFDYIFDFFNRYFETSEKEKIDNWCPRFPDPKWKITKPDIDE